MLSTWSKSDQAFESKDLSVLPTGRKFRPQNSNGANLYEENRPEAGSNFEIIFLKLAEMVPISLWAVFPIRFAVVWLIWLNAALTTGPNFFLEAADFPLQPAGKSWIELATVRLQPADRYRAKWFSLRDNPVLSSVMAGAHLAALSLPGSLDQIRITCSL